MSDIVSLREEVIAKQKALGAIFAAKSDLDFTEDEVADIRAKNKELDDLGSKLDRLSELDGIKQRAGKTVPFAEAKSDTTPAEPKYRSFGEMFVKSAAFTGFTGSKGPAVEVDLEDAFGADRIKHGFKTLFDTTSFVPEVTRIPVILTPGEQQPTIAALMPSGRTSQTSIAYMEETTTTNAAAETAEAGTKPESALAFTERTSPVRKIATFLPVTSEVMEDAPMMEDYINTRLQQFVAYREDSQLLNGDGIAPNLTGILNTAGIQTQAKAADPTPDAIHKAMTKLWTGAYLAADGLVMHPSDWEDIRLLRTADGIYIWGSPSEPGTARIWGLNVTQTTALTAGTALVGAFRSAAQVFRRSDLSLEVSNSHADFFQTNKLAIRVEERLALVVFRPAGFCTVTGI